MNMLSEKLFNSSREQPSPNVLVIGDLMLDHYIFGTATRLSPEAPIPIVNVKRESKIIGGAGNVASNLVELGAKVFLAGITGSDLSGEEILTILKSKEIDTRLIIKDQNRSTTVKTRIITGNHQVARIDKEDTYSISHTIETALFNSLEACIPKIDLVIFSDYNKGIFTNTLSSKIIELCKQFNKRVIIDPKGEDYTKYKGAFIIKPNRKELAQASKIDIIQNPEKLRNAANVIFKTTLTNYLIVTLSEEGIAIITKNTIQIMPVVGSEVYDVTGAGDTVIATLSYCIALGLSIEESCIISNHAAAHVIKHIGSATTTIDQIIKSLKI